jgi:hypothetical protein
MRRLIALLPVLLLVSPSPAQAADDGSGFASLELSSVASGITYDPSRTFGQAVQLSSPFASSAVHLGAGNGISSVAWPGQLGASLGTTLIVAGGAPQAVTVLNDPVVANAKSGTSPDQTNTTVPGSTMEAHASTTAVRSAATAAGLSTEATTTGATYATSSVKATGPSTATGDGTSSLRDVSIAGVVHIGSITSTAHGTTDGVRASASGRTDVTGLTIAGQQVSIGEDGISVVGNALPAGPLLTQVESALAQAQITLTLSRPVKTVSGGTVQYATGSLIVSTPFGIVGLGGVTLNLAATPAFLPTPEPTQPAGGTTGGGSTGATGGTVPGITLPRVDAPSQPTVPAPVTTGLPAPIQAILDVVKPLGLTTGYRGLYVALGLLVAFGCATLFAGLPSRWLPALDDTCSLEKRP